MDYNELPIGFGMALDMNPPVKPAREASFPGCISASGKHPLRPWQGKK